MISRNPLKSRRWWLVVKMRRKWHEAGGTRQDDIRAVRFKADSGG